MRKRIAVPVALLVALLGAGELALLRVFVDLEVSVRLGPTAHEHGYGLVATHWHGLAIALGVAVAAALVVGVLAAGVMREFDALRRAITALLASLSGAPRTPGTRSSREGVPRLPTGAPRPRGARGPRAPGRTFRRPPYSSLLAV